MAVSIKQLHTVTYGLKSYSSIVSYLNGRYCTRLSNTVSVFHIASDNRVFIEYYDTQVLTFLENGAIILNRGSYPTKTTKEVINAFLPGGYSVYSVRGIWRLNTPTYVMDFENGMIIHA